MVQEKFLRAARWFLLDCLSWQVWFIWESLFPISRFTCVSFVYWLIAVPARRSLSGPSKARESKGAEQAADFLRNVCCLRLCLEYHWPGPVTTASPSDSSSSESWSASVRLWLWMIFPDEHQLVLAPEGFSFWPTAALSMECPSRVCSQESGFCLQQNSIFLSWWFLSYSIWSVNFYQSYQDK